MPPAVANLPKITDLTDQRTASEDKITAILASVAARGNKWTDEERTTVDALEVEVANTTKLIETTERAIARAKEHEDRTTAPPPPAATIADGANTEERGNPGPGRNTPHVQGDLRPAHLPFRSLPEQITAIYRVSSPNAGISDSERTRLRNMLEATSKVEGRAAIGNNETIGEDGGFLVQQDQSNQMLKRAVEKSDIISKVDKMEVSRNSNGVKIPGLVDDDQRTGYRMGGVRVYWVDEAQTAPPSKVKLRMVQVSLKKLMGFWYATDEVLNDASMMESIARTAFENEIQWAIEEAILFGDGNIQPLGVFSPMNGALVKIDPESAGGAQAANTVVYKNIAKMIAAFEGNLANAAFYASPETVAEFPTMSMPTGTNSGIALFMPPTGISGTPYGTLWGRPIIKNPHISPLGEDYDLALLDLSEYLLITKGGVQWDSSIHVQFLTDEIVFRIKTRVGGMPKWEKAITPAKGSVKRSPYVALKKRTGS